MDERKIQSICDHLLDRLMAALNAENSAAMDACMHVPVHRDLQKQPLGSPGTFKHRSVTEDDATD